MNKKSLLLTIAMICGMTIVSPFVIFEPTSAASGSTLIIGTTDSIPTLDWADAYDYWSSNTIIQITQGLFEAPRNSTLATPVVVSNYTVSSDGLKYTFNLKQGLKFTDGSSMTASDVIWSLKRAENLNGQPAFLLQGIDNTSYVKINDYSFSLNLTQRDGTFLQRLTYTNAYVFKEQDTGNISSALQPAGYIPIGLGPYYISSWTQNEQMVLTKSQYYDPTILGLPAVANDKVIVQFFTTSANMKTALEGGTIDAAYHTFSPDEVNSLSNNTNLQHASAPTISIRYLVINVQANPNKAVRQAMAASVNRSDFVQSIFQGTNDPLYSMVPPGFANSCKFGDSCAFNQSPDLNLVKSLMEGAGYSTTNKYPIVLWYNNNGHYGDTEPDVANLLKTQFEATGYFNVTLKSTTWQQYTGQFTTMPTFLLGWYPDYQDESDYIDPFVGSGAFDLGTNYTSPTMNGYISTMLQSPNATARAQAEKDAQALIAQDVPLIPLFTMQKQFVAYAKGVTGVALEPSEYLHFDTISKSSSTPGFEFLGVFLVIPAIYTFRKKYRKLN